MFCSGTLVTLMRFSAFIQGNTIARFGGHELPPSIPGFVLKKRMSDAQFYGSCTLSLLADSAAKSEFTIQDE